MKATRLLFLLCVLPMTCVSNAAVITLAMLPFTLSIPEPAVESGKGAEELEFITIRDAEFTKVGQIIFYDDAAKTEESDVFLFFNNGMGRAEVCFTNCAARAMPDFEKKISELDITSLTQFIPAKDLNTGDPIVLSFTVGSDAPGAKDADSDSVTVRNLGIVIPEPSTLAALGAGLTAFAGLGGRRSSRNRR